MTEKRARALHRAMWHWLAKHPKTSKRMWPGWGLVYKDEAIQDIKEGNQCFACWIAVRCSDCPIIKKAGECGTTNDLWSRFLALWYSGSVTPDEWADVCNKMADAWREVV